MVVLSWRPQRRDGAMCHEHADEGRMEAIDFDGESMMPRKPFPTSTWKPSTGYLGEADYDRFFCGVP
eukprot:scaffold242757_cov31-Attheya_sp.AAC.1